jgi:hypothetical protein
VLSDKIDEFLGLFYHHTIYHFYSLQYESEEGFQEV